MRLMKVSSSTFRRVFLAVRKRKLLFILLLIIQLGILIGSSYSIVHYQLKIVNDLTKITDPLNQIDYEDQSIESLDVLVTEYASIYAAYKSMMKNVFQLSLCLIGIYLILNPLLWVGSIFMLSKGWKKETSLKFKLKSISKSWLKYLVSIIVVLVPSSIISYLIIILALNSSETVFGYTVQGLAGFFFFLNFLLLVFFTQVTTVKWKTFFVNFYEIAIKKLLYTIPFFLFMGFSIAGSSYLIYYFTMYLGNIYLMIGSAILLLLILVLSKIFFIVVCQEVKKMD